MNKQEIKLLFLAGMTIGGHSHNHFTFDISNKDVMQKDLRLSKEILFDLLGVQPEIFSYPHGRHSLVALDVLASEGFKYALTIDRRGVAAADGNFLLPRYDTTDIIF